MTNAERPSTMENSKISAQEYILDPARLAEVEKSVELNPHLQEIVADQQAKMPDATRERVLTVLWGLNVL